MPSSRSGSVKKYIAVVEFGTVLFLLCNCKVIAKVFY